MMLALLILCLLLSFTILVVIHFYSKVQEMKAIQDGLMDSIKVAENKVINRNRAIKRSGVVVKELCQGNNEKSQELNYFIECGMNEERMEIDYVRKVVNNKTIKIIK